MQLVDRLALRSRVDRATTDRRCSRVWQRASASSQAVARAGRHESALPAVSEFHNHAGLGIEALVEAKAVLVGRPSFLADWAIELPVEARAWQERAEARAARRAVAWEVRPRGLLALADTLKPTSVEAIRRVESALGSHRCFSPVKTRGPHKRSRTRSGIETGACRCISRRRRRPRWSACNEKAR